jgi:hypothetical protein
VLVAWQQDHRLECELGTLLRPIPDDHFQKLGKLGVRRDRLARAVGDRRRAGRARRRRPRPQRRAPRVERSRRRPTAGRRPVPSTAATHFVVASGEGAGAKSYRVFWGDLHRHSSVSRCSRGFEPDADDRWSFGRDASLCDFMALADHSCQVDALGWWRLDKLCEAARSPASSRSPAFEWSTGLPRPPERDPAGGSCAPFLVETARGG